MLNRLIAVLIVCALMPAAWGDERAAGGLKGKVRSVREETEAVYQGVGLGRALQATLVFDAPGNMTECTRYAPSGEVAKQVTTTYDGKGRVQEQAAGDGKAMTRTSFIYGGPGGRLSRRDTLDAAGNLTEQTRLIYNALGSLPAR